MDYDLARGLIEAHRDRVNFAPYGHGVSPNWIERAQRRLGVRFPPSLIWFFRNYSGGEINGEEVFSIYERDFDTVVGGDIVYMNELLREKGLMSEHQLFIQKDEFGEQFYIDLEHVDERGESPIRRSSNGLSYADDFLHFLERRITEG